MVIRDGTTKVWRMKWFKDVYQLGYRNRGRQRRRWTDDITEWTGMKINEAAAAAEDRDRWREILRAANPSYGGTH